MTRPSLGALAPRLTGVERIAVLRAGGLGDLVFALPALDALRAAYPGAELVLLGAPAHAALLAGRPDSPVDRVEVVPAAPGVRAGESDPALVEAFTARLRAERFGLAAQMHGGGRNSNPFVLRLGAATTIGTATPDATALDRTLPYDVEQHEVLRWLEVAALAGAEPVRVEPALSASAGELAAARALLGPARRHLVLHPGATDPRRQWPADRFAEVAAAVAVEGAVVHVVGDAGEAPIADAVVAGARALLPEEARDRIRSLAGRLDLGGLVGVLAAADLVLANDSGPRHIAQALGTATVGIFWAPNALNAAPLTRARNRALLGWLTVCPICGADVTRPGWGVPRCAHDPSYVDGVATSAVLAAVRELLPA